MKKQLLTIALRLWGISAMAQTFSGITFKTADGKVIPADKVDSVKKALGGDVAFMHKANQPTVMYLVAKTSSEKKAAADSKAKFAAMIGQPAPNFNLQDVDGKKYDLAALKGKAVVLNFWFIACSGCVAEMPQLNRIKSAYQSNEVVFLTLALDKADQLKAFQKTHKFQYAIIPSAGQTHKTYGVYGCPVSMVIDKKGRISTILEAGQPVNQALPAAINAALK